MQAGVGDAERDARGAGRAGVHDHSASLLGTSAILWEGYNSNCSYGCDKYAGNLAGGLVLAGYLFVFRARRRRRKGDPQLVDQPDPSHVER